MSKINNIKGGNMNRSNNKQQTSNRVIGQRISPIKRFAVVFATFVVASLVDRFVSSQLFDNWFLQLLTTLILTLIVVITVAGYFLSNRISKAMSQFREAAYNSTPSAGTRSRSRAGRKVVNSQVKDVKSNKTKSNGGKK